MSSRTWVKGEGFGYDPRERAAAGHLKEGPLTGAVPRERGVVVVAPHIERLMKIQVIIDKVVIFS